MAVAPLDSQLIDMVAKLGENLPIEQKTALIEIVVKHVHIEVLERVAVSSMVRHFTVQELNALADFWESPEGNSAMKKMGAYMADVMPTVEDEIKRAVIRYFESQKKQE